MGYHGLCRLLAGSRSFSAADRPHVVLHDHVCVMFYMSSFPCTKTGPSHGHLAVFGSQPRPAPSWRIHHFSLGQDADRYLRHDIHLTPEAFDDPSPSALLYFRFDRGSLAGWCRTDMAGQETRQPTAVLPTLCHPGPLGPAWLVLSRTGYRRCTGIV